MRKVNTYRQDNFFNYYIFGQQRLTLKILRNIQMVESDRNYKKEFLNLNYEAFNKVRYFKLIFWKMFIIIKIYINYTCQSGINY